MNFGSQNTSIRNEFHFSKRSKADGLSLRRRPFLNQWTVIDSYISFLAPLDRFPGSPFLIKHKKVVSTPPIMASKGKEKEREKEKDERESPSVTEKEKAKEKEKEKEKDKENKKEKEKEKKEKEEKEKLSYDTFNGLAPEFQTTPDMDPNFIFPKEYEVLIDIYQKYYIPMILIESEEVMGFSDGGSNSQGNSLNSSQFPPSPAPVPFVPRPSLFHFLPLILIFILLFWEGIDGQRFRLHFLDVATTTVYS